MAGQGYEISVSEAQAAAGDLQGILETIAAQMKTMASIQTEVLSDANWRGPNKSEYQARFGEYLNSLNALYRNAQEHYAAISSIIRTYVENEQ